MAEIDLTTPAAVKSWAGIVDTNSRADGEIQELVTGFSRYVINLTGIQSFSNVYAVTERRDGNGSPRMFVRNRPIINVEAVVIEGRQIPAAGAWPASGWYVTDDQKAIALQGISSVSRLRLGVPNIRSLTQPGFPRGTGNVTLRYFAGFAQVPADLELAARKACAIHYRRRQTLDVASKALTAGGTTSTTTFRDWELPPEVTSVLDFYSRLAVV